MRTAMEVSQYPDEECSISNSIIRANRLPHDDEASKLPAMHPHWRRALVGASIGFLVATGLFLIDLPGIPGSHPTAYVVGGVVIGALVGQFEWTRVAAYLTLATAIVMALLTLTPVVDGPVKSWIRRDSLPTTPLDAVVVLSSSVNRDGVLDVSGTERLLSGLAIWHRTHARFLITTRVEDRQADRVITSDADQRALIQLGGDTSGWRIAAPAHTTHDEAMRTAEILAPASARTIAVVTSPLHTRRACATFEALGFHVVCIPSDERAYAAYSLPGSVDRIRGFFDWLYEQLAVIKYRSRGWIGHT
jgi:uncharacterized SAM-binding protein YcdF (DUF218 family)